MMVEAGLANLPGDLAEKARKLVEGLKEIAVQSEAAGGSPDDQSMQSPDGANAGAMEQAPGSGPAVGGSADSYGT
jgi:hypothetical protein